VAAFFENRKYEKLKKEYMKAGAEEYTHKALDYLELKGSLVMDGVKNRLSKGGTSELSDFLKDGPITEELKALDFLKALKEYAEEEGFAHGESWQEDVDKCGSWFELLVLIAWRRTAERLAGAFIRTKSDVELLIEISRAIVSDEVRKWEKIIKARAGRA